jgi:translation initiation factor 3 subunit A
LFGLQVKFGALQYVTPELQNLYKYLEVDFHPLQLYPAVQPICQYIANNEDLAMYVPLMEDIIVARVLKQVYSRHSSSLLLA